MRIINTGGLLLLMVTMVVQAVRPPKVESQGFSKNYFFLPLSIPLTNLLSLGFFGFAYV